MKRIFGDIIIHILHHLIIIINSSLITRSQSSSLNALFGNVLLFLYKDIVRVCGMEFNEILMKIVSSDRRTISIFYIGELNI